MDIVHAYAGSCVEAESLSEYGKVIGVGIERTNFSRRNTVAFVEADLRLRFPFDHTFTFGFFQPPCKKFSLAKARPYSDYEDHIPRAREIAERFCDYWVIENVRNSPIGFDPDLRLKGDMFGLPIKFERVFWSNFEIPQPEIINQNAYKYSVNDLRKMKARSIKGYDGSYHVHDIVMNSLPKPYVDHIMASCPAFF